MPSRTSVCMAIVTALICISAGTATWADSIFSVNGLGEMSYPLGAQARGMGGVTLAFLDGRAVSMINPAVIGVVDTTTVSALFLFEQRRLKDEFSKSTVYSWSPRSVRLIVPISHGCVVGGGLAPFSIMNFHLSRNAEALNEPYTVRVSAEGGTHLGSVTVAKNFWNRLFFGASVNFLFGLTTEEWRRDFVDAKYADSYDLLKTRYFGQIFTAGIALRPHRRVSLGAVFNRSGNIDATTERSSAGNFMGEEKHNLDFPDAYGLGMTFRLSSRLTIGTDVYTRLWEKYRWDGTQVPSYKNTARFSLGCELAPSTDRLAPFYVKTPWRIGIYHEPLYYSDESGNNPTETFVTVGTSIFFKDRRGVIDVGIEIGRRGDVAQDGAQEWVFRQSFSITGWERWFQKREY